MIGKRKKIVLIISVLLLPAAFLIFNSCYKDYDLSTADYDTVFTAYGEEADFEDPNYVD